MLQRVQGTLGYLPEKALLEIAHLTGLPSAKVFGVVTFYAQFRLQPVGKHIIRVCRETACHVRGSGRILKAILGTVAVLRDIMDLKHAENVKAQFINMVAHELRAPLAAVDAYLSVMGEGYVKDREKQHEIISRSKQRIASVVDLVDDLLDVARLEAATEQREITPQRIGSVLNTSVNEMRSLADQYNIRLEAQISDELPDIHADREELERLFNNLLSNAIKYNKPDGCVSILAERDGPYVRICIADTGIGISKEGMSRLFSEFFREKRPETNRIKGTGLGLSIVRRIVDFYHGHIEVKSELGKGSTFRVWLPFKQLESSRQNMFK